MILWALIGIFVLFVLFAFLRIPLYKIFGFKICSICAAVSLTWIVLLILKITGAEISGLLIGILIGESIASIMYIFENKAKKQGKNNLLWLKVVIILAGTLLAYLLLTQGLSLSFIVLLIISIIFAIFIYGSLKKGGSKRIVNKKYSKFGKEIKKLEERFEHCCD